MKRSLKILWLDILRIVLVALAVLYFLAALLFYFNFFYGWNVFPSALAKLPLFGMRLFSSLTSNKGLAGVFNYFAVGLIFLLLNFLVEGIQLRVYAEKR